MAKKLYGLNTEQVKTVGALVRKDRRQPPQQQRQRSDTSRPSPTFWALLTGESPTDAGRYSWKKVIPDEYELADPTPPYVIADFTAQEVNLAGGLVGKYVLLEFVGYDNGTPKKPIYFFTATGAITSPQYQYQHLQGGVSNQAVWDFPRAHPPI
jgi:hypothetical protein